MILKIFNYTGVPLFLERSDGITKIGCSSKKDIYLEPSAANYTRFFAKYTGETLKMSGVINVLIESSSKTQVLVLRAIIDGSAKTIKCLEYNHEGNYMYSVVKINIKDAIYYNVSVPLDRSLWFQVKKAIGITFSTEYCQNKDGLLCDKFLLVPIFIWLVMIFLVMCIIIVALIGLQIKNI